MNWSTLRRGQIDALDRRAPVVVPVAAIEQHGEHLPVGTDTMIVEAIVQRLDRALEGRLLIGPTLAVGCSEHHMSFPGTLTLTHETFQQWVLDVAGSVARHGFRRILLLNSHGGNAAVCGVLGERIGHRYPDVECLVTNWWRVAADRLQPLQQGSLGSVGHAGEFETSILMAIAPELVDMSAAEDGGRQPRSAAMHFDMLRGGSAASYRPFDVLSHNGVFGKPSLASTEKGHEVLGAAVAALADLLTDFWPDSFHPE